MIEDLGILIMTEIDSRYSFHLERRKYVRSTLQLPYLESLINALTFPVVMHLANQINPPVTHESARAERISSSKHTSNMRFFTTCRLIQYTVVVQPRISSIFVSDNRRCIGSYTIAAYCVRLRGCGANLLP